MHEPQIGVNALIAWTLWAFSTLLVLTGTIALALDSRDLALAIYAHSMLAIGAAATATLKCYLVQNKRIMADVIELHHDVADRMRRLS